MGYMKTKDYKEVRAYTVVLVTCDGCGTKVLPEEAEKDGWHSFTAGHDEWGNDSCESYEDYDVCSPECYISTFTKIMLNDLYDKKYGTINSINLDFANKLIIYLQK